MSIIVSHCDYGVEKKRHKNAKYPRPLDFEAPALPLCYNCCQRHLRQGGCIAQKQYSCFSPNRPGFDSWLSEKFILMLPRFIDGVGLRKVNGGLKMLVKPVSYNLLELQKDTRGSKSNSKMRFLCKFVAGNWKVAPDLLNFLLFSSWKKISFVHFYPRSHFSKQFMTWQAATSPCVMKLFCKDEKMRLWDESVENCKRASNGRTSTGPGFEPWWKLFSSFFTLLFRKEVGTRQCLKIWKTQSL